MPVFRGGTLKIRWKTQPNECLIWLAKLLCTYYLLLCGSTPGTPPGKPMGTPGEWYSFGISFFWSEGGEFPGFGNSFARPQGHNHQICFSFAHWYNPLDIIWTILQVYDPVWQARWKVLYIVPWNIYVFVCHKKQFPGGVLEVNPWGSK